MFVGVGDCKLFSSKILLQFHHLELRNILGGNLKRILVEVTLTSNKCSYKSLCLWVITPEHMLLVHAKYSTVKSRLSERRLSETTGFFRK